MISLLVVNNDWKQSWWFKAEGKPWHWASCPSAWTECHSCWILSCPGTGGRTSRERLMVFLRILTAMREKLRIYRSRHICLTPWHQSASGSECITACPLSSVDLQSSLFWSPKCQSTKCIYVTLYLNYLLLEHMTLTSHRHILIGFISCQIAQIF